MGLEKGVFVKTFHFLAKGGFAVLTQQASNKRIPIVLVARMSLGYSTCDMVAPFTFVVHAAQVGLDEILCIVKLIWASPSDELVMSSQITGIAKAGAGADGRLLDIPMEGWTIDIPEYHWEAAALLAVGNIWYRDSLLFE